MAVYTRYHLRQQAIKRLLFNRFVPLCSFISISFYPLSFSNAYGEESEIEVLMPENAVKLEAEEYDVRESAHHKILHWANNNKERSFIPLANFYLKQTHPEVLARVKDIIAKTHITAQKPSLGILFKTVKIKLSNGRVVMGMKVTRAVRGKSAAKAGVMKDDIIICMNSPLPEPSDKPYVTKRFIPYLPIGKKVPFHILRAGQPIKIFIRVGAKTEKLDSEKEEQRKLDNFEEWLKTKLAAEQSR